ncbi:MAG: PrsW family glutamic-type intramembrane protease [Brevibacterium sp.]
MQRPPQQGMPQQQPMPPQQPSNDRFRPRPQQGPGPGTQQPQRPIPQPGMAAQNHLGGGMGNGPGQPPMQGQPMQGQPMPGGPQMYAQPQVPAQPQMYAPPMQPRVYEQPRFAPTVTQEMRIRAGVQAPQQMVTETPWTGAVRQSRPVEEAPDSTGNIIRLVLAIVVLVALVGGLLILALLGGIALGLRIFALIGLSAIPLIGIITYVLWLDRWKPQPKLLLGICLLWGAVASVTLTLLLGFVGDIALYLIGINGLPNVVGAVIQAPIVEESTKTVLLVAIVLAARRHFEGPLDGLVYGALIGAGFAFTENVLYLGGAWQSSEGELWQTFVLRCLCSPFLHTLFSTCAGVTIGLAARKWPWWAVVLMWFPGLIVGMILHGLWNLTMSILSIFNSQVVVSTGLILLSVILTGCWVTLGLILRRSERLHTLNMLGDYANTGWLTHAEVDMLGTWKGRKFGRQWADSFPGGKEEMRTMIRTSGELSTTRMRLLAGLGGETERALERFQLKKFSSARDRLLAASRRTAG